MRYNPNRAVDVKDSLADISKAKALLGYAPDYSLKTGLAVTWDYFSKQ